MVLLNFFAIKLIIEGEIKGGEVAPGSLSFFRLLVKYIFIIYTIGRR